MMEIKSGMLAKSKAGHDKGKIYLIIRQDEAYVYLADGSAKTFADPKKKRKKHVQIICRQYEISEIDDSRIHALIKEYENEIRPTL